MKSVPHERIALVEEGMIVFFFERQWNKWRFFTKCALLLLWWPVVVKQIRAAKADVFYEHSL